MLASLVGAPARPTSSRRRQRSVRVTVALALLAINIFDDITDRKRAELEERFLSESSRVLGSSIDFEATLDNVAHLAVPQFADWCVVYMVDPLGIPRTVAVAHADPSKIELVEELVRLTVLMRPHAAQLVDRYSERKAAGVPIDRGSDLSSIALNGR